METRYLQKIIQGDPLSSSKMAFVSGPRQCGKTTLAEKILTDHNCSKNYFTWDDDDFKRLWLHSPSDLLPKVAIPGEQNPIIVLDELHKYRKWKNSLKGFYDLHRKRVRILVTGSAKLNTYRKTGDSLAGRYIPFHLHPFSLGESDEITPPPEKGWERVMPYSQKFDVDDLLMLGGFPEPLLGSNQARAVRWWRLYREQIVREDLRDFKAFRDLQQISALVSLLLGKVSGGFSFQSIQEDLSISFATVREWITALETVFLCFLIRPYSKRIQGSLRKEPKVYFYHWAALQDPGARLENMIACHLLKSVNAWTDAAMGEFELHYIRDKQKREVDFCVTKDAKPWLLLEVKNSERQISPALSYYTDLLKPMIAIQLHGVGTTHRRLFTSAGSVVELMGVERFLKVLN